jgi:hypothetical protein
VRQLTAAKVRLDSGKSVLFTASAQSIDRFDRLPRARCDLSLPKPPEGAIVASQLPGIRGMSDDIEAGS